MERIRLVVGRMPRLLRDILETSLADQEGVSVISAGHAGVELPRLLDRERPALLIVGSRDGQPDPDELRLLAERPWLRILLVDGDGRRGTLYETVGSEGHRRPPVELSLEGLRATLRESVVRGPRDAAHAPGPRR